MNHLSLLDKKHCRWCGIAYYAKQPYHRDGFHTKACKQAHYRALNRYVTAKHQRTRVHRIS